MEIIVSGHYAPVTGIDSHSAVGHVDFSELFLTSSFDWSVKLWSSRVILVRQIGDVKRPDPAMLC